MIIESFERIQTPQHPPPLPPPPNKKKKKKKKKDLRVKANPEVLVSKYNA